METLDQIEAQDAARRDRAWRYQRVSGEVARIQRLIAQLEPQVTASDATVDLLNRVEQMATQLPNDLEGTMSYIARDQIVGACLAAKTRTQKHIASVNRQLEDARGELPALEAKLAEIES